MASGEIIIKGGFVVDPTQKIDGVVGDVAIRDGKIVDKVSSSATVIDAKVTAKSMTHGYESWWRVGTAQVSENPKVEEAAKKIAREVESARKF